MITARAVGISVLVAVFASTLVYGEDWDAFTPSDLTTGPVVDKNADAEALFWYVRIEQKESRTILSHYLRIKIFTARGAEAQSRIDLPYSGKDKIVDIKGRTIKPDGSIVDLKPDSIFQRDVVKGKKLRIQVKTIAMPAVTPGSLIEYKWSNSRSEDDPFHLAFDLQRDIPVRRVEYSIKPLSIPFSAYVKVFNISGDSTTTDPKGNLITTVSSVPAFQAEPNMPSEATARAWLLLWYNDPSVNYWQMFSEAMYNDLKSRMKVTDEIRRAAASLVDGAVTPEEKLKRIYDFCATSIKSINDDAPGQSAEAMSKLKASKSPTETLARKMGTGKDIDLLFGALATAAGFDARYAMLGDRYGLPVDPDYPTPFLLTSYNIAVWLNNRWTFFDPGMQYLPFGMLRWAEEGVLALVVDPKKAIFARTQLSGPEKSLTKRTATLRLEEDGTIEGDVTLVLLGHTAAAQRELLDELTPSEREEHVRKAVQSRLGSAEISNVQIENITDVRSVLTQKYHVRVPGFAQRTGRRLLFQPGYFEQGIPVSFTASTRVHPVDFRYAWTESDTITIQLPAGFELDNADRPQPVSLANVAKQGISIRISPDSRTLHYSRQFSFGLPIMFPAAAYDALKKGFEVFHEGDNHTIAIRQSAASQENRQ